MTRSGSIAVTTLQLSRIGRREVPEYLPAGRHPDQGDVDYVTDGVSHLMMGVWIGGIEMAELLHVRDPRTARDGSLNTPATRSRVSFLRLQASTSIPTHQVRGGLHSGGT